jgi:hypothetical protein
MTDRNDEQPPQRQHARKPPGQRNGDDLGDQIRRCIQLIASRDIASAS